MQDSITKCLGLVTQYNSLTTAEGAMSQADDAIIRRENIIESRRGYNSYSSAALSSTPTQLTTYLSRVIAHQGKPFHTTTDQEHLQITLVHTLRRLVIC